MSRTYYYNPKQFITTIKYNFIYGLDDAMTQKIFNDKNSLVAQRKFFRSIFNEIPTTSDDFIKTNRKGRKTDFKPVEHLLHYWDTDSWGNYIYALCWYAGTYEDGWNRAGAYNLQANPEKLSRIQFLCNILTTDKWDLIENPLTSPDGRILYPKEIEYLEKMGIIRTDKNYINIRQTKINNKDGTVSVAFQEMLYFFSKFAPLSSIGFSILQRISDGQIHIPIIVNGQSPFLPLKQENIYRCLLAIANNLYIKIDRTGSSSPMKTSEKKEKKTNKKDVLVKPLRLEFHDNFLFERNQNAYVCVEGPNEETYLCPIPDDILLDLCPSTKDKVPETAGISEFIDTSPLVEWIYSIDLLYNINTENYIKRKATRIWAPEHNGSISTDKINKRIHYYPQNGSWDICQLQYMIQDNDQKNFERFIRSFGDFVHAKDAQQVPDKIERKGIAAISFKPEDPRTTRANYLYSLCTPYNSLEFIREYKGSSISKDGFIPSLTIIELYWLEFIMIKYKNFCTMFLHDHEDQHTEIPNAPSLYEKIFRSLQDEIKEREENICSGKTFRNIFWIDKDNKQSYFDPKINDLRGKNEAVKYHKIYQGIKEQRIFKEKFIKEHLGENSIIPYSLNFNVGDHTLNKCAKNAMSIMAYSMIQKRTVMITYNSFDATDSITCSGYHFSEADIWYHLLSYLIRVGYEGGNRSDRVDLPSTRNKKERLVHWETLYCSEFTKCIHCLHSIQGMKRLFDDAFQPIYDVTYSSKENAWMSRNQEELDCNGEELFSEIELIYRINILQLFYKVQEQDHQNLKTILNALYGHLNSEDEGITDLIRKILFCMIMGNSKDISFLQEKFEKCQRLLNPIIHGFLSEILYPPDNPTFDISLESHLPKMNEISYTNSILKRREVQFRLKPSMEVSQKTLDLIYEYFRGYNCLAKIDQEGNIIFRVEYERFHFRKIHETLLALNDLIEVTAPKETAEIIKNRTDNQTGGTHDHQAL